MFKRLRHSGFTVIEMMVVLATIMILLGMLMMPLLESAQRSAWTATCSSNLHQIGAARISFYLDNPHGNLEAGNWTLLSDNYLNGSREVLICPEGSEGLGNIERDMQIALWYRHLNPGEDPAIGKAHAYSALDAANYRIVKVSESQVASGMSTQNGQNFFNRNPTYNGFDPGSTPEAWRYWYNHDSVGHGDLDYDDTRIRVSIDGSIATVDVWTEQAMLNAGYITWIVRKDNKRNLLPGDPGNIPAQWTSVDIPISVSNYGMNWNTPKLGAGGDAKIFAIDYMETIVKVGTWDKWHDASGVPSYARHPGDTLNAVRLDGSVSAIDPWAIDPQMIGNERQYWTP